VFRNGRAARVKWFRTQADIVGGLHGTLASAFNVFGVGGVPLHQMARWRRDRSRLRRGRPACSPWRDENRLRRDISPPRALFPGPGLLVYVAQPG
jgi:hypothetical protein